MLKSLIVEDNAEFRAFLKALLFDRFPDGEVQEASNAGDAYRLLADGQPHIVLVDLSLSGTMNGLKLIGRIREKGRRPPILILSNYALPEYQLEAARLGADWFLPKVDCTSKEIIAAVERLTMMGAAAP